MKILVDSLPNKCSDCDFCYYDYDNSSDKGHYMCWHRHCVIDDRKKPSENNCSFKSFSSYEKGD